MRPQIPFRAAAAALLVAGAGSAFAQGAPLKIGLMLPYTGTFAAIGTTIENGFKLYVQEQGGKLGGREIQYFKVDDESDPSKATDNVNKLIKRDNVDVLVGSVHSGVALAMAKAAKDNNTLLVIPNAGADAITGPMCGANIVRSSFSNWQPGYAMGVVAAQKGVKRAMTITWNYAAGNESIKGFTEGFEKGGGKVVKDLNRAVPERRVPGPADRDRGAEARRGLRLLRRRRRGQVRQGLRRGGPQQDDPALRPRLPDRRHARGAGRIGARHADHAALCRRPEHAEEQRLPQGLRASPTSRSPTCTRCRATTRRRSSAPASRR